VNLASVSGFNSSVALTCAPSSSQFACSITPGSLTVNGAATATVTVNATLPVSAQALPLNHGPGQRPPRWPAAAATLAFCLLFVRRGRFMGGGRGAWLRSVWLSLALFAAFAFTGCGGGSTTSKTNPPPGSTPAGTYTIVVTGTANGMVHNAVITVVVP
jgi:hypothetical protein